MLPAAPESLSLTQVSASTAQALWTLTHHTADAGADSLTLSLRYSTTGSIVRTTDLPGDSTSQLMEGLIPATNYSLQLTARNVDGKTSSDTQYFSTEAGPPLLDSVRVTRLNHTHFDIVVNVTYTGGGLIRTILVMRGDTGSVERLEEVESLSGSGWQATLILDDETIEDFQFTVSVGNEYEFESNQIVATGECIAWPAGLSGGVITRLCLCVCVSPDDVIARSLGLTFTITL